MTRPSPTEIAIRAYTESPNRKPVGSKTDLRPKHEPSPWVLVFDCETTTDATQRLKFGVFQVWNLEKGRRLAESGIFFDSGAISAEEAAFLHDYGRANSLSVMSVADFRFKVFLRYGYELAATIVGFNLPFDLSRIAIAQGPARGAMRDGFTFKLSQDRRVPCVRVKHLGPRAALIDFAKPGKQETPRGMRNRDLKVPKWRGSFVDVKTLAAALTSQSFSLGSLATALKVPTQKHDTDEHGGPITATYLDYARADVQVTWECYVELVLRLGDHDLDIHASKVLSEASLGKAYLTKMGIRPLLAYQPEIPRSIFGTIMASYFGGRAEVRLRRVPVRVCYTDFKSMYPTVNSLTGLWRFVIGSRLTWRDATPETRALLDRITLEDLKRPETWRLLATLVKIRPDRDILPVRAKYDEKINTIGLNELTCEQPLWYTLADCIASKLLTGKTPVIDEAISFDPGPPQDDLKPINLFGRDDLVIDPYKVDFFARLIDLRDEMKAKRDPVEKQLKIVANSTVYGIFIEVNRDDAPKPEPLDVYGPDGECTRIASTAIEEPGKFFHPMMGTLITGAARLMLAITESLILRHSLDYAFCDTDSMAIAKPEGMPEEVFAAKVTTIIDWFKALNPYRKAGSILKVEDINFDPNTGTPVPVYCYAISAKRYALFNVGPDGMPIIRKASAHGLGYLLAPYGETDAPTDIPRPAVPLSDIGVKRWQHDLWFEIIQAALAGTPNRVALDYHPALAQPAVSRYGATSPRLLKWMEHWNHGKPYPDQIKPFGFMLSLTLRTGPFAEFVCDDTIDLTKRGRPAESSRIKPVAQFDQDHAAAIAQAFDRDSGEPVHPKQLKTYAEALVQFHISTEDKFENGDFLDRGRTERRHVLVRRITLIGKEANKVGESGDAHPAESAQALYHSTAVTKYSSD